MDFYDVLDKVQALLSERGRVSYRALQRQFALVDEDLEALKDELIYAKRLAVDEDGRVLVWVGEAAAPSPLYFGYPLAHEDDAQRWTRVRRASGSAWPCPP